VSQQPAFPVFCFEEQKVPYPAGAPTRKHPFAAHALQNYTNFGKICVAFHHLATLFNNTNA